MQVLTRVFDCSDDKSEPVSVSSPIVGDIFEGDEVAACEQRPYLLLRVAARQVHLEDDDVYL